MDKNKYAKIFEKTHEKIRKEFEDKGLTIESFELGDSYFIFNFGDNAVMHFKLKEAPNWKFGVWLFYHEAKKPYNENSREYIEYKIFAQNELWIDKFKPSRSEFLQEDTIDFYEIENDNGEIVGFDTTNIPEVFVFTHKFKLIWQEKYLAFYVHMHGPLNENYATRLKAFGYYVSFNLNEYFDKVRKAKYLKKQFKLAKKFCKNIS